MDTLLRTKKLEALGFERPKAEGLVLMVKQSIEEEVVKKTDIVKLESDITRLESEIKRVEQTLGLKITSESKSLFIKIIISMITMTGIILREMK